MLADWIVSYFIITLQNEHSAQNIGVLHPGLWVQASVRTKLFRLEYTIYTLELSEEDEIKTGNTNSNTIIC